MRITVRLVDLVSGTGDRFGGTGLEPSYLSAGATFFTKASRVVVSAGVSVYDLHFPTSHGDSLTLRQFMQGLPGIRLFSFAHGRKV